MSSGFWIVVGPFLLGLLLGLGVGVPLVFIAARSYWKGPRR